MIKVDNISKIYRVGKDDFYALDNVSLEIAGGDFLAIRGTSGSGKTTLLHILGCLDSYSGGTYILDGMDVGKLSDDKKAALRNKKIGFVLQDFALINNKTVLYNVMVPLLFGKTPFKKIKSMALEALDRVGIKDQAGKRANQLSGGQRQRVAIARAIVNSPEIILADEPTGSLDSENSRQIMNLLKTMNDGGITVVVVTHDDKVASFCKRQLFIEDGKITEPTGA